MDASGNGRQIKPSTIAALITGAISIGTIIYGVMDYNSRIGDIYAGISLACIILIAIAEILVGLFIIKILKKGIDYERVSSLNDVSLGGFGFPIACAFYLFFGFWTPTFNMVDGIFARSGIICFGAILLTYLALANRKKNILYSVIIWGATLFFIANTLETVFRHNKDYCIIIWSLAAVGAILSTFAGLPQRNIKKCRRYITLLSAAIAFVIAFIALFLGNY